jgi:SAM-dependent methyltransferase
MGHPRLRVAPSGVDRYGRPTYEVAQQKGLAHVTSHSLTLNATRAGYTDAVDRALNAAIVDAVARVASGQRIDVFEVGGGSGWLFDRIRRHIATYVNVEPGDVELDATGRRRLEDPRYASIRCSAEDLPLASASFDLALSLASLDHVPDHRAALAEIARCLRPSGCLLLELNNRGSWWKRMLAGTDVLRRRTEAIAREHWFQWTLAECLTAVAEHFEVASARTLTFFPYVPLVWRAALPVADRIGPRLAPDRGGNMLVLLRRRSGASA